jgi:hypothetical protein
MELFSIRIRRTFQLVSTLKALTIGKKVKQATKAIKMSVNVIPLIQRNIKENTEKLKYKKANEGQEVKEE